MSGLRFALWGHRCVLSSFLIAVLVYENISLHAFFFQPISFLYQNTFQWLRCIRRYRGNQIPPWPHSSYTKMLLKTHYYFYFYILCKYILNSCFFVLVFAMKNKKLNSFFSLSFDVKISFFFFNTLWIYEKYLKFVVFIHYFVCCFDVF